MKRVFNNLVKKTLAYKQKMACTALCVVCTLLCWSCQHRKSAEPAELIIGKWERIAYGPSDDQMLSATMVTIGNFFLMEQCDITNNK